MYSARKSQRNMSTGRWVRIRRHRPRGYPIPYLLAPDGVSLPRPFGQLPASPANSGHFLPDQAFALAAKSK